MGVLGNERASFYFLGEFIACDSADFVDCVKVKLFMNGIGQRSLAGLAARASRRFSRVSCHGTTGPSRVGSGREMVPSRPVVPSRTDLASTMTGAINITLQNSIISRTTKKYTCSLICPACLPSRSVPVQRQFSTKMHMVPQGTGREWVPSRQNINLPRPVSWSRDGPCDC